MTGQFQLTLIHDSIKDHFKALSPAGVPQRDASALNDDRYFLDLEQYPFYLMTGGIKRRHIAEALGPEFPTGHGRIYRFKPPALDALPNGGCSINLRDGSWLTFSDSESHQEATATPVEIVNSEISRAYRRYLSREHSVQALFPALFLVGAIEEVIDIGHRNRRDKTKLLGTLSLSTRQVSIQSGGAISCVDAAVFQRRSKDSATVNLQALSDALSASHYYGEDVTIEWSATTGYVHLKCYQFHAVIRKER